MAKRTSASTTKSTTSGSALALRAPPTDEDIRRRAFEIYLQRGGLPGSPEEDWARAERELRMG